MKKKIELDESTFETVGEYIDKRMADDSELSWLTLFEEGLQKLRDIHVDENIISFLYLIMGQYSTKCLKDGMARGVQIEWSWYVIRWISWLYRRNIYWL